MENQDLIGVIMPFCKEGLEVAKAAAESVLNQTHKNFELFAVLDDPGNLEVREYLKKIQRDDKRVRFLQNDETKGVSYCRNRAISLSKGKIHYAGGRG